jgi:chromosome segregation ATPase
MHCSNLPYPLAKENAKLATENTLLKENLKNKEEQLQVLSVQRTALETSLFELTARVEEDKKEIEAKKKQVVHIKSLFEHTQMVSGLRLHSINLCFCACN